MTTRLFIPGLAVALLVAAVALYLGDRAAYVLVLDALREHPFRTPFIDTRFVTAQVECWQRGVDVYAANPCDPLGRTQDYSPLWLRLGFLGRTDRWTPALGLASDALFAGALFLIPWPRAGAFATAVAALAVISWTTVFALERGNSDLLMFAVAVAFAHLRQRSAMVRDAGHALVLGAGLLKFYPLVLLGLVVREPARRMWVIGGLCGVVLLAFVLAFRAELSRIGANMAGGYFANMFGARTLPFGLVEIWRGWREMGGLEPGHAALMLGAAAVFAALASGCVAGAAMLARGRVLPAALARLEPATRSMLLVGAVLCVGCFFGHQNIGYRAVFLLPVVPGLLELARLAPGGRTRAVLHATSLAVLVTLWGNVADATLLAWLAVQLAWWWITGVLAAIVAVEIAPSLRAILRAAWPGRRSVERAVAPEAC